MAFPSQASLQDNASGEDDVYQEVAISGFELLKNPLGVLEKLKQDLRSLDWTSLVETKESYEFLQLKINEKLDKDDLVESNKEMEKGSSDHGDECQILKLVREWVLFLENNCYLLVLNLVALMISCEAAKQGFLALRRELQTVVDGHSDGQELPTMVFKLITLLDMPQLELGNKEKGMSCTIEEDAVIMDFIYKKLFSAREGINSVATICDSVLILTLVSDAIAMPEAKLSLDKFVLAAFGRTLKLVEYDLWVLELWILAVKTYLRGRKELSSADNNGSAGQEITEDA